MNWVLFIGVFLSLLTAIHERPRHLAAAAALGSPASAERLHPAYKLPVRCFAYVGDESNIKTWKLPYLLSDGRVDLKRLPAAIQAVVTSYRGKKVYDIPNDRLPDVLVRLGWAAAQAGKMPFQDHKAAAIYRELQTALEKLGHLDEIKAGSPKS